MSARFLVSYNARLGAAVKLAIYPQNASEAAAHTALRGWPVPQLRRLNGRQSAAKNWSYEQLLAVTIEWLLYYRPLPV